MIGSDYGHRFDDRQHSWIFLSEYISISYSYMTFVIQNSRHSGLEQGLESDAANSFDLEAYNYLFNRKTIFTDLIYQRKESAGSQKDGALYNSGFSPGRGRSLAPHPNLRRRNTEKGKLSVFEG